MTWGGFYNEHKDEKLNAAKLEKRIVELIEDDEVDSKKGIYEYLLTDNEKTLSLRAFDQKTQITVYEKQKGFCPVCKKHFDIGEMEADHIVPAIPPPPRSLLLDSSYCSSRGRVFHSSNLYPGK